MVTGNAKQEKIECEEIDIIEVMAKAEVDRWDMDTTIEYCVDGTIDFLNSCDRETLCNIWDDLFDELKNPFKDGSE